MIPRVWKPPHTEVHISSRTYAISDIHGHHGEFLAALKHIDLGRDAGAELVLLGDYIDRGTESFEVLTTVRELTRRYPDRVTALLGNHDAWMLDWLDGDDDDLSWLMSDLDLVTVKSMLSPLTLAHALGHSDPNSDASTLDGETLNRNMKRAVADAHADLITWLRALPLVHETPEQIFVHAGVDEEAGELWRAATPDYVFTEKYPPSLGAFHKTIIAGHVRTAELHDDNSHGVFFDGHSHYYIDAMVEQTRSLNVLRYDRDSGEYNSELIAGPPNSRALEELHAWWASSAR